MDYDKNGYTIKSVDADGNLIITFDCDNKQQVIANAPLESADALKDFVSDYLQAYKEGKKQEEPNVSKDVKDLFGKKLEVEG